MLSLPFSIIGSQGLTTKDNPSQLTTAPTHGAARVALAYDLFSKKTQVRIDPNQLHINEFQLSLGCMYTDKPHFAWDEKIDFHKGIYIDEDGSQYQIEKGLIQHATRGNYRVTGSKEKGFQLEHTLTGEKRCFNEYGQIISITDSNGKTMQFNGKGQRIESVDFGNGKRLAFNDDATNQIKLEFDGKLLQTLHYQKGSLSKITYGDDEYEVNINDNTKQLAIFQTDGTQLKIKKKYNKIDSDRR